MKKILIIDDEEKVLTVLNRMLGHLGYESDAADNWEDGLARYGKGEFDLVMLDVHIPGRDGFNVAREIKEKNPGQKIIIITGLDAGSVFQRLCESEVDFNDILYKPFTAEKLRQVLSNVLGG